jgi:hypothetical protein
MIAFSFCVELQKCWDIPRGWGVYGCIGIWQFHGSFSGRNLEFCASMPFSLIIFENYVHCVLFIIASCHWLWANFSKASLCESLWPGCFGPDRHCESSPRVLANQIVSEPIYNLWPIVDARGLVPDF